MTRPDLRLAIFDCDGTLVDSLVAIHEAMVAAFRDHGLAAPSEATLRGMIGLSVAEQIVVLAPGAPPDVRVALEDGYRFHRLSRRDPPEPMFPGARDCLETLDRAGILMSVATAKSSKGLFATLERHDLRQFFVNLQTGDRHPGKPNPSMVLASLAEAGVDPENAVVIGDTRFDIEMAVNAGVTPIGVAWGYHEPQSLLSAGAQEIAPDFSALTRKILDRFC